MPRNMSFSMTTQAVIDRKKTVTRRLGWSDLEPGDLLWAVEKGMGLKKGEKVKRLALIRVVSVTSEPLSALWYEPHYGLEELRAEGFPGIGVWDFIDMFCAHNHIQPHQQVNRIEFEYVAGEEAES